MPSPKVNPCLKVCVSPCGTPVVGAKITLYNPDGSVAGSCTTDATGCCNPGATGSLTATITAGGALIYSGKIGIPVAGSGPILIGVSSSYFVCCGSLAIPRTLTLQGPGGMCSFAYDSSSYYPLWTGGYAVQKSSCPVTTPGNICTVGDPSSGPVRVCYQMVCRAGQSPTFAVQRSWSWVYQAGTQVPIYYQDASGFSPGQSCFTAPPAICGSPLTDTAGFGADPSSLSPFVLIGTPTPANSNATADPDAGQVVISA